MLERSFLVALHSIGLSQKKLMEIFLLQENYKEIWEGLDDKFLSNYYSDLTSREKILEKKKELSFEKLERILTERKVHIMTLHDPDYPESLKNIAHTPYFFYIRGKLNNAPKIALVGSRTMTSYGKKCIEDLIPNIAKYFTIVSGGAAGCDSEAHVQTLKSAGKTIAVIGTGINVDYPASNKKLFSDIVESGGAVMSIFPLGESGQLYNFPIRNEIISGLSVGVLLVEAGEKSGTLITGQLALEQGRDVFAIPGDIYKSNSAGCNYFIKSGQAKMVTKVGDILEEYNLSTTSTGNKSTPLFQNEQEQYIYNLLILEPLSIDEIAKKLQKTSSEVSTTLSFLEIRSILRKTSNGHYEVC